MYLGAVGESPNGTVQHMSCPQATNGAALLQGLTA